MPITTSAQKALRQTVRKRKSNLRYLTKIRLITKEIRMLASQAKEETAKALLPKLYKALDKAAKEKVIKKNAAARTKSRLTVLLTKTAKAAKAK